MNILSINAGSSSLKVALFAIESERETCTARGTVDHIGKGSGRLIVKDGRGRTLHDKEGVYTGQVEALGGVLDAFERAALPPVEAIGHRLVHGGPGHFAPVLVTPELRASLAELVQFAPLHLPSELEVLDAVTQWRPNVAQVACFDTAFHRRMPEVAERYALPRKLFDDGVRRYGFHGLSYEYIVESIGPAKLRRAVIAHLGSGASLVAVKDGRSIDTTMGLTPTGGLIMGTRVGDLDPGVLLHLMENLGYTARDLATLLNDESGLLGVSGTTNDMQRLLDVRAHDPRAALAVEMFCYAARKFVGAFAAVLGGMDTLVFTGGIGEHAAPVRAQICEGLAHLGVTIDPEANARGDGCVGVASTGCRVLVVPTDEERMIARHVFRLCA